MNDSLFETVSYDIFDKPFDSIEGVANFILCEENDAHAYSALRYVIRREATSDKPLDWTDTTIRCVCGLPEARLLMSMADSPFTANTIARRILNRAVSILRGTSFT